MTFRNNQLPPFDQLGHLDPPVRINSRIENIEARKIIPKGIMLRLEVADVWFSQRNPIHKNALVDQVNPIPWDAHNSLDEMLRGIHGIVENDDVATPDRPIRNDVVDKPAPPVTQLIHQQIISSEQRVLH